MEEGVLTAIKGDLPKDHEIYHSSEGENIDRLIIDELSSKACIQQFRCKICEIKKSSDELAVRFEAYSKTTKIKLLTVRNPNTSHASIVGHGPSNIEVRDLGMEMTSSSRQVRTFSGLMSRWMIPLEWRCQRPIPVQCEC